MATKPQPQVQLISPDGELQAFDADSAKNLVEGFSGYTPATPENLAHLREVQGQSGIGKGLLAGVEGGARGLTSGLSDVAEVKLGLTTPEALQLRQEAHPNVAAVARFAGQTAQLGGAAALAAAAVPATLGLGAAALAGGVLGGAAAGGLGGATEEFSRQVLGPAPLVGEQIAQHAISGAVGGAVGGILGWAGGQALGRVFKGAAGLSDFAERQALRGTGASAGDLAALDAKGLTQPVARQMLDRGYFGSGLFGNDAAAARAAAQADVAGGSGTVSLLAKEADKLLQRAAAKAEQPGGANMFGIPKDLSVPLGLAMVEPSAAATYLATKFATQAARGGNIARAADYLSTTGLVNKLAAASSTQWDKAIGQVLGGTVGTAGKALLEPGKFDQIASGVERAAQSPELFAGMVQDAIGHDITEHHPEIATQAALRVQHAFKFLDDNRPRSKFPPTPYDNRYTPPDYLKVQWLDMVRGVADPASVASNPTRDSLAAMRAVYPESYSAIVARMNDRLATHGDSLPYHSKIAASQFLGMPLSTQINPGLAQRVQQLYAQTQQEAQQPEGQKGSARNAGARQMRIKQIAQDDTTTVDRMRSSGGMQV